MLRTDLLLAPRALSRPIVELFSNIIISRADTMATALTRHMMVSISAMLLLSRSSHEKRAGLASRMVVSFRS